ncbi:MAG TPA: diacylglycerol kinase family protein, partial [Rubricoccaceae bacterium]
ALAGTATRFGILPLGTGNDFARAIGMPGGIAAGVRAVATAVSQPLDVGAVRWTDGRGEAQHCVVVNALGAGFDAAAAQRAAGFKALGGRTAYLAAVVQELWAWRRPGVEVEVSVDDAVAPDGLAVGAGGRVVYAGPLFLCEVGNGQAVGGGFRLTPDARLDDGLLDVCVVRHVRPRRVLRVLPTAFTGGHVRFPEVEMHRAVRVAIRATSGTLGIHSDGEATATDAVALDIEAWPEALHVLVPSPDGAA